MNVLNNAVAENAGAVTAQLFCSSKVIDGKLYQAGIDTPLLVGIKGVSIGDKANVIEFLTGEKLVFTPKWEICSQNIAMLGNFLIISTDELEKEDAYNLVKGTKLLVIDVTSKQVVYSGIRAFMVLDKKHHLIRLENGGWMYYDAQNGKPLCPKALRKVNFRVGKVGFMIDERGKIRLGANGLYYTNCLTF